LDGWGNFVDVVAQDTESDVFRMGFDDWESVWHPAYNFVARTLQDRGKTRNDLRGTYLFVELLVLLESSYPLHLG
jgi:hypothetical protein